MTTRQHERGPSPIRRVIALGASNLTRGFHTVVSTSTTLWGPDVEVFAALGHGRSYGAPSFFLGRTLPGILQAGLWTELARRSSVPTRGLVTDVGNDIIYGFSVQQILDWVDATAVRLQRFTDDIVLTDLPALNIQSLSPARFLFFRSIYAPRCRLSLEQVADRARRLNDALASLAAARNLRFIRLRQEWYGWDPIHIRASLWRPAWREILCGIDELTQGLDGGSSWIEGLRLYTMRPERQWLFGSERYTPQTGIALSSGGRVWLY